MGSFRSACCCFGSPLQVGVAAKLIMRIQYMCMPFNHPTRALALPLPRCYDLVADTLRWELQRPSATKASLPAAPFLGPSSQRLTPSALPISLSPPTTRIDQLFACTMSTTLDQLKQYTTVVS